MKNAQKAGSYVKNIVSTAPPPRRVSALAGFQAGRGGKNTTHWSAAAIIFALASVLLAGTLLLAQSLAVKPDATGNLVLHWPGVTGSHYRVESSSNLLDWAWSPADLLGAGTDLGNVVHSNGVAENRKFWRVVTYDVNAIMAPASIGLFNNTLASVLPQIGASYAWTITGGDFLETQWRLNHPFCRQHAGRGHPHLRSDPVRLDRRLQLVPGHGHQPPRQAAHHYSGICDRGAGRPHRQRGKPVGGGLGVEHCGRCHYLRRHQQPDHLHRGFRRPPDAPMHPTRGGLSAAADPVVVQVLATNAGAWNTPLSEQPAALADQPQRRRRRMGVCQHAPHRGSVDLPRWRLRRRGVLSRQHSATRRQRMAHAFPRIPT